jgi:carbon-monoxide dehydrogenase large subunit
MTNTTPTGAYRGAGRPEAIYIIERLMDAAARADGMDRRAAPPQHDPPGADALQEPMGQTYDSGQFEQIMDQGLALADWNGFEARRGQSRRRAGNGCAAAASPPSSNGPAATRCRGARHGQRAAADGIIELTRGHPGRWARASPPATRSWRWTCSACRSSRVRVLQGDTDRANGFGSAGSRSLFTGGSAVQVASERTVDARQEPWRPTRWRPARRHRIPGRPLHRRAPTSASACSSWPRSSRAAHHRTDQRHRRRPTWPNGCHICEVEVDPATGEVEVLDLCVGQRHRPGGQPDHRARPDRRRRGAGHRPGAVRAVVYDRDSGQLLTASFMDYALPRADGFRGFKTKFDTSVPARTNPLGVKGVGELGTIGATPAVVNAVVDALAAPAWAARREGADAADAERVCSSASWNCQPWPPPRRATPCIRLGR